MDVKHSSDTVVNMVQSYASTIESLNIVKSRIRGNYEDLVDRGWDGEAQEAFFAEYERWNSVFEIYIQRLDEMRRVLSVHRLHGDTIRNTSVHRFGNLF
jgi:WXG100 family type VII secretion target